MSNTPVIVSLLDTDLYKFTALQVALHHCPHTPSIYRFRCRNPHDAAYPLGVLLHDIERELLALEQLHWTEDDLQFLRSLPFINESLIQHLRGLRLRREQVTLSSDEQGQLCLCISGVLTEVMLFEIFVLAIINELYYRRLPAEPALTQGKQRLQEKILLLQKFAQEDASRRQPFNFMDFGTRRRYSRAWHEYVIQTLQEANLPNFIGTSNVYLARQYNLTPAGTMSHEFLQMFQGMVPLPHFQTAALQAWLEAYQGQLGIALTDVITMDAFLQDFNPELARAFSGLRHDSGDPIAWGEKARRHYQRLGIDTRDKTLVFSNQLDLHSARRLYKHFETDFRLGFGIGTHLTNDMGLAPLNIVIKLASCHGQPTAKISDEPEKTMSDDEAFVRQIRQVFTRTPASHNRSAQQSS